MKLFDIEDDLSLMLADAVAIQNLSMQAEECLPLKDSYLAHTIYTLAEDQQRLEEKISAALVELRDDIKN